MPASLAPNLVGERKEEGMILGIYSAEIDTVSSTFLEAKITFNFENERESKGFWETFIKNRPNVGGF